MPVTFKALVINQEGEKFTRAVSDLNLDFLKDGDVLIKVDYSCLLYTSPSPRDRRLSRMPSSA